VSGKRTMKRRRRRALKRKKERKKERERAIRDAARRLLGPPEPDWADLHKTYLWEKLKITYQVKVT